jgi:hypothetical protein
MTTLASPAVPSKSNRTRPTRVLRYDIMTAALTIMVTTGKRVVEATYSLERIGSDFGDGYKLTKHVGHPGDECDIYHVNLSDEGSTCDCKGASRHGHCKHIDAVRKIRELGMI